MRLQVRFGMDTMLQPLHLLPEAWSWGLLQQQEVGLEDIPVLYHKPIHLTEHPTSHHLRGLSTHLPVLIFLWKLSQALMLQMAWDTYPLFNFKKVRIYNTLNQKNLSHLIFHLHHHKRRYSITYYKDHSVVNQRKLLRTFRPVFHQYFKMGFFHFARSPYRVTFS